MSTDSSDLLTKDIPGSYGNIITVIQDRLAFYKSNDNFFQAKQTKYNSTVYRSNMPPGPFMAKDPRCVVLLDAKSFPILFDVSKVEKRDLFTGTYMPSTALTGGIRACSYLDPSEPTHAKVKQLLFNLLASRKGQVLPVFHSSYSGLFDQMELQVAETKKSDFNKLNDNFAFEFLGKAYFGLAPSETELGTKGSSKASKWLLFQLHPLVSLGLPTIVEELLLHTFPLPPFLVKSDYNDLYKYFETAAADALDGAEKLGLSRSEACHNLLFATCFNSYGGVKVLFPGILQFLAKSGPELHRKLAQEIRAEVTAEGGKLTVAAIERMELTKSVVYEALRMDPPVKFQYGKAKEDMVIQSHEAKFKVKKDEMLFGYQPFATRDEKVFGPNAKQFVPDRFVGEKGKTLLKYVLWSNGPETETPTVMDKQCAGKNFVVLVGRLLVAEFFIRYDTFTADVGTLLLGAQVTVTSLTKAT